MSSSIIPPQLCSFTLSDYNLFYIRKNCWWKSCPFCEIGIIILLGKFLRSRVFLDKVYSAKRRLLWIIKSLYSEKYITGFTKHPRIYIFFSQICIIIRLDISIIVHFYKAFYRFFEIEEHTKSHICRLHKIPIAFLFPVAKFIRLYFRFYLRGISTP